MTSTLDLLDGVLRAGNSLPPATCFSPAQLVAVPTNGNVYATCGGANDNLVVVNESTEQAIASVSVGTAPWGVAYDSGNGELFVSNSGGDSVSVVDPTTESVVTTVPVFLTPEGLASDPTDGKVFVANDFSNNVSVLDTSTDKVLTTVPTGGYPVGVAYDSALDEVFVTDRETGNVSVLNGATNALVASIPVGSQPEGVCVDSPQALVYVGNFGSDNVSVIDTGTNTVVATVAVGSSPQGVACDTTNGNVYVSDSGNDNVTVIASSTHLVVGSENVGADPDGVAVDTHLDEVFVANRGSTNLSGLSGSGGSTETIPLGYDLQGVDYDASNGELYVANSGEENVSVLAGATNSVLTSVGVGLDPTAVAFDPDNGEVYVADAGANAVSVIDGATNAVVATVGVGYEPVALAVDPSTDAVYVADLYGNDVTVIDGATNTVSATVPVESYPDGIAYDTDDLQVYVADAGSNNVSVINAATNTLAANYKVGSYPTAVVFDPGDQALYVADQGTDQVSVLDPANGSFLATLPVARSPQGLGYDGTNGDVLVAASGAGELTVISGTIDLGNLTVGLSPAAVVYDGADGLAYVSDSGDSAVTVVTPSSTIPTLTGVVVSPGTGTFAVGLSGIFSVVPVCAAGGCPSGATFAWALNNSLGSLTSPSGLSTTFTAGGTPGLSNLTLSASLNAVIASSWVDLRITPAITSVAITPSSLLVTVGSSGSFDATAGCTPAPCPAAEIAYSWGLNNTRGSLNTTTGALVLFTAGTRSGLVDLSLAASLGGSTGGTAASVDVVAALFAVKVAPNATLVGVHGEVNLSASLLCDGGPCSGGATFVWSLNNSLGTIPPTSGASATFTAGAKPGLATVDVVADLDGRFATGASNLTLVPTLSSVAIGPGSLVVAPGGRQNFTALPSCLGGSCPSGISFAWSLNGTWGSLRPVSGAPYTLFTAGPASASGTISLNATYLGHWRLATASIQVVAGLPALVDLTVTPSLALVHPGDTLGLNATPMCQPGPCPASLLAFDWDVNSSLGSVVATTLGSAQFTAGPALGTVQVNATVTLFGLPWEATAAIAISTVSVPTLVGVELSFGTLVGQNRTFSAEALCSPGPCPPIVTYAWTLSEPFGNLTAASGPTTTFSPSRSSGSVTLTVVATLNDASAENSTTIVLFSTSLPITGVAVAPTQPTVDVGSTTAFTATPDCAPQPQCPSGITFTWGLDDPLGNLSATTGASVSFQAGNRSGDELITVTATLDGSSVGDSTTITIIAPTASPSTFLGLPTDEGYALLALLAGVAVTVLLLAVPRRSTRQRVPAHPADGSSGGEEPAPPAPVESSATPAPPGAAPSAAPPALAASPRTTEEEGARPPLPSRPG